VIVVDTNVIAYFLTQSDHTADAEAVLRKDPEWAAPALWRSELRSVLLLQIRHEMIDLKGAISKFEEGLRVVGGRELEVDPARVLDLAVRSGCTTYDCEFVYAAETLDAPLVTADKKVLAAFPEISVSMTDFVK
jgi:predicted nucleic acid-binding protein